MTNRILIVDARFYTDIADELLEGATEVLKQEGVAFDHVSVPGALEIPTAIRMAIETGKYAGFIALGCVIRGETTHYDYVCIESARGLNQLAIDFMMPVANGILTVENRAQAHARSRKTEKNKGGFAARACLDMLQLKRHFGLVKA